MSKNFNSKNAINIYSPNNYDEDDLANLHVEEAKEEEAKKPTTTELTAPKGRPNFSQLEEIYPTKELMESREPIIDYAPDRNKTKKERRPIRRVDPEETSRKTEQRENEPLTVTNQIIRQNVSDRQLIKALDATITMMHQQHAPCPNPIHDSPGGVPKGKFCETCLNSGHFPTADQAESLSNMFDKHQEIAMHNAAVQFHKENCTVNQCHFNCPINDAERFFQHKKNCHKIVSGCEKKHKDNLTINQVDNQIWHCDQNCDHVVGQKTDWQDLTNSPGVFGAVDRVRNRIFKEREEREKANPGRPDLVGPQRKETHGTHSSATDEALELSGYKLFKDDFKGVDPKLILSNNAFLVINGNTANPDASLRSTEKQEPFEVYTPAPFESTRPSFKPKWEDKLKDFQDKFLPSPLRQKLLTSDAASTRGWTDPQSFAVRLATSAGGKKHMMAVFGTNIEDRREDHRSRNLGSDAQKKPIIYDNMETVNNSYNDKNDVKNRLSLQRSVSNTFNLIKSKLGTFSPVRKGEWTIMEVPDTHVIPLNDFNAALYATVGHHKERVPSKIFKNNENQYSEDNVGVENEHKGTVPAMVYHRKSTQLDAESIRRAIYTTKNPRVSRAMLAKGRQINKQFGVKAGDLDSLVPEFEGSEVESLSTKKHNLSIPELDNDLYGDSELQFPMAEEASVLSSPEKIEDRARKLIENVHNLRLKNTGKGLSDEQKESFVDHLKNNGKISEAMKAIGIDDEEDKK